ncbi:MAG: hypothetical protein U0840_02395 [Gemmataceae bacterium]
MDRFPVLTPTRPAIMEKAPLPNTASRWTPWFMGLGLLSMGVSFAIAGLSISPLARPSTPTPPPSQSERRAVAVAYVDVEGGVRPLYPALPGRVVEANVPEGKEVDEGTVLLKVDDALAQARLKEAQVDLQAAREKLVQARKLIAQHKTRVIMQKAALDAANRKLEAAEAQARKARRFFQDKVGGTSEDVESANKLVAEAQAGVRVEESRLELAQSMDPQSAVRMAQLEVEAKQEQVQKADVGLRECALTAPCKGMILRRLVNVGEMLGAARSRPAIEFCPSGDRIVRAEVEQEFAAKLHIGQKATISDDITGSGEWRGEVLRISDWFTQRRAVLLEPMQYNDIRTLEVIIQLKNDAKNVLRINQRVRVKLDGAE